MLSAAFFVTFALLCWLAVCRVRSYLALRQFGGHWTAGWSRLWMLRSSASGRMNVIFTEINNEYGSTARVAPKMLITTDPVLMRRMNAVRSPFTRGPWYRSLKLHPKLENIASQVDERIHAEIRTKMAPGYSGKENVHIEHDIDEKLLQYLDLIQRNYLSRDGAFKILDLARVTTFFTMDVISKLAFGETFGFLDADTDLFGYIANVKEFLPALIIFGVYDELTQIVKLPGIKALLPSSADKRGLGRVMGFARDRVAERFGVKPILRRDMLGSFIKRGLTQEELESETLTQITAGSDSSASALRITLLNISTSPVILERLLSEARSAIADCRISRPVIKDSEARRLPYLQACIKEGLRVYPPITGVLPKMVPPGGVLINVDGKERFVPAGTQIGWNPWGMMRRKDIFGADAEIYRPERWLPKDSGEGEKARLDRMTETVTMVFGYGRFGCLGRGVAIMELNKVLIEILLRFNLQPCSIARPFDEMVLGFYVHSNMNFVVTERQELQHAADALFTAGVAMDVAALPGAYDD